MAVRPPRGAARPKSATIAETAYRRQHHALYAVFVFVFAQTVAERAFLFLFYFLSFWEGYRILEWVVARKMYASENVDIEVNFLSLR